MDSVPIRDNASPDHALNPLAQPQLIDFWMALALVLPLLVRLFHDGVNVAPLRLTLLALAFAVAYLWNALFLRQLGRKPEACQVHFAMLFALLLPAAVGWSGTLLATSFGWVVGREIFGGKAILPPVLVTLSFAIFSFPNGGYEALEILSSEPSLLLALSCLPGAAWLLWKGFLSWRIVVGAIIGAAATVILMAASSWPPWWEHFILGTFSTGILFLAATTQTAPRQESARWLYGALVGSLVIIIRLASPNHPDGVVFAVLICGLFAPLLDRVLSWRPRHE